MILRTQLALRSRCAARPTLGSSRSYTGSTAWKCIHQTREWRVGRYLLVVFLLCLAGWMVASVEGKKTVSRSSSQRTL